MIDRGIDRVVTTPPPSPGFIGAGHTAVPVLDAREFARNDPFILLMDDRIDLEPGRQAGAAHPHGGFETVTFVVEGELRDREEGMLRTGDVVWMTAGSGVIHNENVVPLGKSRILQLWQRRALARESPPRSRAGAGISRFMSTHGLVRSLGAMRSAFREGDGHGPSK